MLEEESHVARFKNTKFLSGLRAYAALAVMFIHSGGFGLRELNVSSPFLLGLLNRLVDFGKYGVVVFFVLSAYTIAMSLDRNPKISYKDYLTRRLLRVIPMYYLMVVIAFCYGGVPAYFEQFDVTNSWYNLFAHLTFINLFQIQYRNNLLGVEWSVPIEIFYYLFIPFIFACFKKYKHFGAHLFLITLSLALLLPITLSNDLVFHWSVTKYLFSFCFGLILYQWQKTQTLPKLNSYVIVELFILLLCYICSGLTYHEEFIALWTGALILCAHSRSTLSKLLFENRIVMFLGTVSYSFYLIHYPVLTLLKHFGFVSFIGGVLALFLTALLSHFTYIFIEAPLIAYGRKKSAI